MTVVLALSVVVSVALVFVRAEDTSWIQTVCERVRKVDKSLVNHIKNLASSDRNDFLNDLREYVQAIRSFQSCVEQDKQATQELAKDILDEEGPKFYYHYDPEYIQNTLNFSEAEMDECDRLRKQAVDAWHDIDQKLSGNGNE